MFINKIQNFELQYLYDENFVQNRAKIASQIKFSILVTEVISNNMYTITYTCNISINKNDNTTHYIIIIIHKNKLEIHLIQIFYRNELLSDSFFSLPM